FEIAAEGVDKGSDTKQIGVVVVTIVRSEDFFIVDVIDRGKEGDIVVGKAELLGVFRGEAHRTAEHRVICPDPVLQEEREETYRERHVETGGATGKTGIDGAEGTLEAQILRVEVELTVELAIAIATAELIAGEGIVLLDRGEEGVYSLGASDLEVDVEVQPGRDLCNIFAVIAVVGNRRAPVT